MFDMMDLVDREIDREEQERTERSLTRYSVSASSPDATDWEELQRRLDFENWVQWWVLTGESPSMKMSRKCRRKRLNRKRRQKSRRQANQMKVPVSGLFDWDYDAQAFIDRIQKLPSYEN